MGKRYYCDFCDKSFADNPTSRKNHLKGLQHQRNRKAHYDAFRDPEVILDEEQAKRPCKTFMSTGECQFMDNCRFSHLTEQKRKNLEQQIAEKREVNHSKTSSSANDEEGRKLLDSWLEEYHKKHKTDEDRDATVKQEPVVLPQYTIPPHVLAVPNPPPSLLPPPPDAFENLQFLDWG